MPIRTIPTEFAPAEREPEKRLLEQVALFAASPYSGLLDDIPMAVLVLNNCRQIIFCNDSFRKLVLRQRDKMIEGQRPGEALGCGYAHLTEGGCGTSEFCRFCGAARAIIKSLEGFSDVQFCRMVRPLHYFETLDLQVFTKPVQGFEDKFVLASILDVSYEHHLMSVRNKFLIKIEKWAQRIHSMFRELNCVQTLSCAGEGLPFALEYACRHLLGAIENEKDVFLAEEGKFKVDLVSVPLDEVIERTVLMFGMEFGAGCILVKGRKCGNVLAERRHLEFCLGQLVENALEASPAGEKVTLTCVRNGDMLGVGVHNHGVLPEESVTELFRRNYTTKGEGRGYGLYYARLLIERYFGGRIDFRSDPLNGVVFTLWLPEAATSGEE